MLFSVWRKNGCIKLFNHLSFFQTLFPAVDPWIDFPEERLTLILSLPGNVNNNNYFYAELPRINCLRKPPPPPLGRFCQVQLVTHKKVFGSWAVAAAAGIQDSGARYSTVHLSLSRSRVEVTQETMAAAEVVKDIAGATSPLLGAVTCLRAQRTPWTGLTRSQDPMRGNKQAI